MIYSLLFAIFMFVMFLYCLGTGDTSVLPWVYFIIGLLNLAVWIAEYVVAKIKKHINETLKK